MTELAPSELEAIVGWFLACDGPEDWPYHQKVRREMGITIDHAERLRLIALYEAHQPEIRLCVEHGYWIGEGDHCPDRPQGPFAADRPCRIQGPPGHEKKLRTLDNADNPGDET